MFSGRNYLIFAADSITGGVSLPRSFLFLVKDISHRVHPDFKRRRFQRFSAEGWLPRHTLPGFNSIEHLLERITVREPERGGKE